MIRFATAFALVAGPLAADVDGFHGPRPEITYHEDPGPDDAWFGRVVIKNREGSNGGPRVYHTSHGPVTVTHLVTSNDPCYGDKALPWEHCADIIRASDLPEGVEAVPQSLSAGENTTEVIYLYQQHLGF